MTGCARVWPGMLKYLLILGKIYIGSDEGMSENRQLYPDAFKSEHYRLDPELARDKW
jgi:hypothetical protein